MYHPIDHERARKLVLKALRAGNTRTAACAYAGISRDSLIRWIQSDEAFRDLVRKAEAKPEMQMVDIVAKAAQEGTWYAAAWWLERRRHEDWKKRDELDIRKLSTEQLLDALTAVESGAESSGDRAATAEERE